MTMPSILAGPDLLAQGWGDPEAPLCDRLRDRSFHRPRGVLVPSREAAMHCCGLIAETGAVWSRLILEGLVRHAILEDRAVLWDVNTVVGTRVGIGLRVGEDGELGRAVGGLKYQPPMRADNNCSLMSFGVHCPEQLKCSR